jgi:hypothetical protein
VPVTAASEGVVSATAFLNRGPPGQDGLMLKPQGAAPCIDLPRFPPGDLW